MPANYCGTGYVGAGGHQIVAARTGEFGFDARPTAKVPDFQCPIVAAGHHFRRFAEKFGRHHFATVPGQRMLLK